MTDSVTVAVSAVISRHAAKVGYLSPPDAKVAIEFISSAGIVAPIGYSFPIAGCDDLCTAESVGRLVAWWYLQILDAEPAFLQELSLRRVDGQVTADATLSAHPVADRMCFVLRFPSHSSVDRAEAEARSHLHDFFAGAQAALAEPVRAIVTEFNANPNLWALVPAEARAMAQRRLAPAFAG